MQDPERKPEETLSWSATLRADILRVAEQIAETEDRLAETLRHLASQHPREADRLRVKIDAAQACAAQARRMASDLQDRATAGSPAGDFLMLPRRRSAGP